MNFNIINFRPMSQSHKSIEAFFDLKLIDIGITIKECRLMLKNDGERFWVTPSRKSGDRWINLVGIYNEDLKIRVLEKAKEVMFTNELPQFYEQKN